MKEKNPKNQKKKELKPIQKNTGAADTGLPQMIILSQKAEAEVQKESLPQTLPINKEQEKQKQNLYIIVIISVMLIILLATGVFVWSRYSKDNFEYVGLDFQKILFDKLLLYHAKIPITASTGNVIANFNFYLRNDPRSLEDIPIEGRISLTREAIVALENSMEDCADNSIAGVGLGQFLAAAGVTARGGSTNQTLAEEQGLSYASCDSPLSVIITEKASATKITQEGSCYKIQVANCSDVVRATERFMLGTIGHSSGYEI